MSYTQKEMKKFVKTNFDAILANSTVCGVIAEMISAREDGHQYVNMSGYDQYNPRTKIRTEVKFTNTIQRGGSLRIQNLLSKQTRSDYIKVIDGIQNRKFLIPTKVFFKQAHLYSDGSFWWSASYNEDDNIQCSNTELLLKYEVY